jgi:hypothetical protein
MPVKHLFVYNADVVNEEEAAHLEAEIAEVCGIVNAAMGRLVGLLAKALETGGWEGFGIRSPEQWVAWRCGVSPAHARQLVAMARRLGELPRTRAALEAGELAEDQVTVSCRHPTGANGSTRGASTFRSRNQLLREWC